MQAVVSQNGQEQPHYSVHPLKFMLWLAMGGMVMLFAAFTSAYVVRRAAGNWLEFQLPTIFAWSTGVLLLSSLTLQLSYYWGKTGKPRLLQLATGITILLGIVFTIMQYQGWQLLTASGLQLGDNPSTSFVYVITGAHVVHLLGGLLILLIQFLKSLSKKNPFQHPLYWKLTVTYWHFVDGLWIYLFFFLLLYR